MLEPINTRPGMPPAQALSRRAIDFDGHPVTAILFRGRWTWRAAEVGTAIGYEAGRILVDKIRGDWREDFREGKDYELLRGTDLREFTGLNDSSGSLESSGRGGARSLLVLFESGVDRALILSRTDKGRRLRDLLVDHVLPQLRASGTATLPGAPSQAPGIDMDALRKMVSDILAEQLKALVPPAADTGQPILGASDLGTVLIPLRRLAAKMAGAGAAKKDVARARGKIDRRLRRSVAWEARWCLFPRARLGELLAALQVETRLADEFVEALAATRQPPLRAVR